MRNLQFFAGYFLLFATALYFSAILGEVGVLWAAGAGILALLWMLLQKLGQIEQKLDELLEQRNDTGK